MAKESTVFIQGVPRYCILRDISFSGAKLIMMGVAKFLVEKPAALRMDFDDPKESFLLVGKFVRAEPVEGRKELVALAILFNESMVPMGYKIRINNYISQVRAEDRGSERQKEANQAAKKPAPEKAAGTPPKEAPPAEAKAESWPSPDEAAGAAGPAAEPGAKAQGGDDFDLNVSSS
jgi:hypothetical protein